jgi:hypothetical protein
MIKNRIKQKLLAIKNPIKQKLLEKGFFFSGSTTKEEEILNTLNLLKPKKTEHDLVRIGNPYGDGGYLLPNDFKGIEYCFSPGVSEEISFDLEIAERGIECFLADYSVERPPVDHKNIRFTKKFISSFTKNNCINVNQWIIDNSNNFKGDGLLEMDIEGQEYEVISSLEEDLLKKFRIIVIEFHHLHHLFEEVSYNLMNSVFLKLSKYFRVVHLHPNNYSSILKKNNVIIPELMEITFLRKDRISNSSPSTDFPNKLDRNNTDNKDLVLPKCWYK